MISIYAEFARSVAAMPVLVGRKSRLESFAGANSTYTIEAMMGDRRALQVTPQWLQQTWPLMNHCCYAVAACLLSALQRCNLPAESLPLLQAFTCFVISAQAQAQHIHRVCCDCHGLLLHAAQQTLSSAT